MGCTLTSASTSASALDRASASALEHASTSASVLVLDRALDRTSASDFARDLGRALDLDLDLAVSLMNLDVFPTPTFKRLRQVFQDCDPGTYKSWSAYIEWSNSQWLSALNFKGEDLDVLIQSAETIETYLIISDLMFDCRDRASGLSKKDWDEIERKLLFLT